MLLINKERNLFFFERKISYINQRFMHKYTKVGADLAQKHFTASKGIRQIHSQAFPNRIALLNKKKSLEQSPPNSRATDLEDLEDNLEANSILNTSSVAYDLKDLAKEDIQLIENLIKNTSTPNGIGHPLIITLIRIENELFIKVEGNITKNPCHFRFKDIKNFLLPFKDRFGNNQYMCSLLEPVIISKDMVYNISHISRSGTALDQEFIEAIKRQRKQLSEKEEKINSDNNVD